MYQPLKEDLVSERIWHRGFGSHNKLRIME